MLIFSVKPLMGLITGIIYIAGNFFSPRLLFTTLCVSDMSINEYIHIIPEANVKPFKRFNLFLHHLTGYLTGLCIQLKISTATM